MAEIKVEWTHFAKKQRDEIFGYWNNRNKSNSYSKKLNLVIKEKTNQLKLQPFSGKKTINETTRMLVFKNYSLIYNIEQETISIISFWENHQNPEALENILGLWLSTNYHLSISKATPKFRLTFRHKSIVSLGTTALGRPIFWMRFIICLLAKVFWEILTLIIF